MPYIINVPGTPQPYITNDPRIYMDCTKMFGWSCQSRPFSDSYCQSLRQAEARRFQCDKRREQLELHWAEELRLQRQQRQYADVARVAVQAYAAVCVEADDAVSVKSVNSMDSVETVGLVTCPKSEDKIRSIVVEVKELEEHDEEVEKIAQRHARSDSAYCGM